MIISGLILPSQTEKPKTSSQEAKLIDVSNANLNTHTLQVTSFSLFSPRANRFEERNISKMSDLKFRKQIIKIIFFIFLPLIFLINLHYILFFKLNFPKTPVIYQKINSNKSHLFIPETECSPSGSYYTNIMNTRYWLIIDMFFSFVIPFITMSFTFVFVCRKFIILNKVYTWWLTQNPANKIIFNKKIRKNKRALLKLFLVNFYFLVSILPYFLFKIYWENNFTFLESFFMILFYSNNALNFFFYGTSCKKFRQILCSLT